ncbi:MAG: cytochrome c, partial [Verrucomicrobia bacterium]|nr:cytochrome c [Verrucomicrobiota bacterium]
LAGAAISNGEKNTMIKVVLHGLTGPIEGKTYLGQIMVPMAQESDQWIADVLTEVRSSWGNKGDAVTPDDVAKVRKATKNVMEPYTMETLMK